jgi:hypothetical protein
MLKQSKKGRASLAGMICMVSLIGCAGDLDNLNQLTTKVKADIHMSETADYESVDDSQLLVDLGNIYIEQESTAWFSLESLGNAPAMIDTLSFLRTQGDGWMKPQLKKNETSDELETPHTLDARDTYLVEVMVAPMITGDLSAELEITIPGLDPVVVRVTGRAVDGSVTFVPGVTTTEMPPLVIDEPVVDVWPEESTEEPEVEVDDTPVEPEPVIEEEEIEEEIEELEEEEVGVDVDQQLPPQIDEPLVDDEPEDEIEEEVDPIEDIEPETLIGGNIVADDESEDVIVICVVKGGGYNHDLYLDNTNTFICNSADIGTQVNLGTFPAGTELIFRLDVSSTGYSYYTGAAERNPDSEIHARIDTLESGAHRFGFEDLYGGGDRDYDDCVFEVSGSDADWLE